MITYKTHFWDFYMSNKKDIDKIINSIIYKYYNLIELNELKSQILYALCNSNILSDFDPNKSQIQTFLFQKIKGYTSHIINKILKENKYFDTLEEHSATYTNPEYIKDIFLLLKKRSDSTEWDIFSKHLKGWNFTDIAKEHKISLTLVSRKYNKIKNKLRTILQNQS